MNMHILRPLLLLCYGGVANILCSRDDESSQDLRSLLHFKQGITSDPHGALSDWNTSCHYCRWNGVTCTPTQPYRVSELSLSGQSLSGQISSFLGNLSFLECLDLSDNNFVGPLPLLGRLQHLRYLSLNENSLSGIIIPDALTNCSNLITLDLSSNLLVGSITPKLGLLSNLEFLFLDSNQLEGRIPDELGQLVNLIALDLGHNRISGEVSHAVFSLSSLQLLSLEYNMLGKALLPNIGEHLTNLTYLLLASNAFEGLIPVSLGNAQSLILIDLSHNKFTGQIPTTFGKLAFLEELDLDYNQLVARNNQDWAFLSALRNCRSLNYLSLSYNELQGPIPQSIGNLSADHQYLRLAGNNLSGHIPRGIGNLSALGWLDLGENYFSGIIEGSIDNLTQMEHLDLHGNEFEGPILASLVNLPRLRQLYLNDNNLQGYIP